MPETLSAVPPDFNAAIDLATPEIYEQNAFRLLELPTQAGERDLSRRREWMEKAARNGLPVPPGPARILPRTPPPDDNEIRLAAYGIQDAERRLAYEFFWFWPAQPGGAADDGALQLLAQGQLEAALSVWRGGPAESTTEVAGQQKARAGSPPSETAPAASQRADSRTSDATCADRIAALHNLAVFHHLSALSTEKELHAALAGTKAVSLDKLRKRADRHWREAAPLWPRLLQDARLWERVAERVRAIADPSLTTGATRRLERSLPTVIALIDARLALQAAAAGRKNDVKRHIVRLRQCGLKAEAIEDALRRAIEPSRAVLKSLCTAASKEGGEHPEEGAKICVRLLEQTVAPLGMVAALLPEGHLIRVAVFDLLAESAFGCVIGFANKMKDWEEVGALLARIAPFAASPALKEKVAQNRKICEQNAAEDCCWFCGKNRPDEACAHSVAMYGDVNRIPTVNGMRTTWNHGTVKVPRCRQCVEEGSLKGWFGFGALLVAVLGIVNTIIVGNLIEDYDIEAGAFALICVGTLATFGAGAWYTYRRLARRYLRPGIKLRPFIDYPGVALQRSRGWQLGSGPVG